MEEISKHEKRKLKQEQKELINQQQSKEKKKKKLIKHIKIYSILTIVLIIIILVVSGIKKSNENGTGNGENNLDKFAQCLTEKGFSMGGTDWCPHCKDQKELFGNSFKFIDYHNCDKENDWCQLNNIRGYPTWVLPDKTTLPGTQKLETLAEESGCAL